MEIYLIRHTSPDVAPGVCYGQSDVALAASFEEEWQQLHTKLPASFDRVYTSPLQRCEQLARQLSTPELVEDIRLVELNFGDWEMRTWDDIPLEETASWMNDFVTVACPNGESYQGLAVRVQDFWEQLRQEDVATVAVVAHGGPIRVMLAAALSLPLEHAFRLTISYGSVSLVSQYEAFVTVGFVNR